MNIASYIAFFGELFSSCSLAHHSGFLGLLFEISQGQPPGQKDPPPIILAMPVCALHGIPTLHHPLPHPRKLPTWISWLIPSNFQCVLFALFHCLKEYILPMSLLFPHGNAVSQNYNIILECWSCSWGFLLRKFTGLLVASWNLGEWRCMKWSPRGHSCCWWRKLGRATSHPGWRILKQEDSKPVTTRRRNLREKLRRNLEFCRCPGWGSAQRQNTLIKAIVLTE